VSEFIMPSLGADMTVGTLAKWRVAAGDCVSQGDIIAEVETDKGLIEVEVFESGRVGKLLVEEGARVPVGTPLAEIVSGAAPVSGTVSAPAPAPATVPVARAGAETAPVPAPVTAPGGIISSGASHPRLDGPMASPAVRRRAHELDLPLEGLRGSGEHGRITLEDLQGLSRGAESSTERIRVSPYARRLAIERGLDLSKLRGTGPTGAIQASDVLGASSNASGMSEAAPDTPAERLQRVHVLLATRLARLVGLPVVLPVGLIVGVVHEGAATRPYNSGFPLPHGPPPR